jgi:phospholipid/cholesterol/gamma-HCH transport system substrate-binding protein
MERRVEFRVGLFIIVTTLLIIASLGYVAYKKDVFSKVYTYTLYSETGENITEGMPVLFWGFNIGKVSSMELTEDSVLIQIKIPERNNRVIRKNSRFVLEKPVLGSSRIIVYTDDLNEPPLTSDLMRELTVSDDINELIERVQIIAEKTDTIVGNMTLITQNLTTIAGDIADPQGDINRILKNTEKMTSRFAEQESLIEILVGNEESTKSIQQFIDNANNISVRMDGILRKADLFADKTNEEIYGQEGILIILRDILNDLMMKMEKVEVAIDNITRTSGEAVNVTKDLTVLRNDVDETFMAIKNIVDDLDQLIPFDKESEINLP